MRRGKFLWAETDGGPDLGLHLGMAGRIVLDEEPIGWDRFVLEFADGGRLALRDKRRLGRAVIEPDFTHVGPDAAEVSRDVFRERVGRGTMALKARLLDQRTIAGVGNLLADEILWRARLSPLRSAGSLSHEELDALRRVVRAALRDAIRLGGAHTGDFIAARRRGALCPRCGVRYRGRRWVGGRRSGAARARTTAGNKGGGQPAPRRGSGRLVSLSLTKRPIAPAMARCRSPARGPGEPRGQSCHRPTRRS